MRVVIDHVAGSRRGQRQEFPVGARLRFGRHPECEVSFDPQRDIDASSRHAELRAADDEGWILVDLGSSNGTYVDGKRVTEAPVAAANPINIEFGPGGPRIRLFVGDDAAIEALPRAPIEPVRPPWWTPAIAGGIAVVLVILVVAMARC